MKVASRGGDGMGGSVSQAQEEVAAVALLGIGLTQQVAALPSRRPWERAGVGFCGKAQR